MGSISAAIGISLSAMMFAVEASSRMFTAQSKINTVMNSADSASAMIFGMPRAIFSHGEALDNSAA